MADEDDALFKAFLESKEGNWSSQVVGVIDRTSLLFANEYYDCSEMEPPICFRCKSQPMEFRNFPCGCALWCSDCSKWAYDTIKEEHRKIEEEHQKKEEEHQKVSTEEGGNNQVYVSSRTSETPAIRCIYCGEHVHRMVRMAPQVALGYQNNERHPVFDALMGEWGASKNHCGKHKNPNPMDDKCMRCGERERVFKNFRCGCVVWCVDCLNWAINVGWPHPCLLCNRQVEAFGGEDGNLIYQMMMDDNKVYPRDVGFFQNYYINFKTTQTCFGCGTKPMEWRNLPCGCQLWCTKCKELAEYIVFANQMEHLCTTCASPVNAMENYTKQQQFDWRYVYKGKEEKVPKQQKKKEKRESKKNKKLCSGSGSSSSSTQVQQIPEGQEDDE